MNMKRQHASSIAEAVQEIFVNSAVFTDSLNKNNSVGFRSFHPYMIIIRLIEIMYGIFLFFTLFIVFNIKVSRKYRDKESNNNYNFSAIIIKYFFAFCGNY